MDFVITRIDRSNIEEINNLALANGGSDKMQGGYFEHLYFNNPSNSNSLWKVTLDNKIEGFAITNNFKFFIDDKICNVALPQNVLTSVKLRGKGLFNKLYNKTELDNIETNEIDYFLTFTNELSTPIFLSKFGYSKGLCPNLLIFIFNPLHLITKAKYKRISNINEIDFERMVIYSNALYKSKEYFIWRYQFYDKNSLHILAIYDDSEIIGYVFFVKKRKKGISFLILADIVVYDLKNISKIINSSKNYVSRQLFPFSIMLNINFNRNSLAITLKNRFNFLVKGKTKEETKDLSNKNFNLFFGDLDII